jgi:HemY protein
VVVVMVAIVAGLAAVYGAVGDAPPTLAMAGVSIALVTALLLVAAAWLLQAPARVDQQRGDARRRARQDALSRGFLALGAGDPKAARRWADVADPPGAGPAHPLSHLLAAWAAEADGDLDAAVEAYEPLTAHPDARLAARRGLMLIARRRGDEPAMLAHAEAAYADPAAPAWAWRVLFDARLRRGQAEDAARLIEDGRGRGAIRPDAAVRLQALLAAEARPDPKAVDRALRETDAAA